MTQSLSSLSRSAQSFCLSDASLLQYFLSVSPSIFQDLHLTQQWGLRSVVGTGDNCLICYNCGAVPLLWWLMVSEIHLALEFQCSSHCWGGTCCRNECVFQLVPSWRTVVSNTANLTGDLFFDWVKAFTEKIRTGVTGALESVPSEFVTISNSKGFISHLHEENH